MSCNAETCVADLCNVFRVFVIKFFEFYTTERGSRSHDHFLFKRSNMKEDEKFAQATNICVCDKVSSLKQTSSTT